MTSLLIQSADGTEVRAYCPTREDVESLQVGDLAPDPFGRLAEVSMIFARGHDVKGALYACYYTVSGGGGSVSNLIKENRIVRSVDVCRYFNSAQIDFIERNEQKRRAA